MVARLFTDEQEKEICRRYKEGESSIKIGKNLGASNSCISNIVKRNNETMRRSGGLAVDLVNKRFGELIVKKISKRRTPSGGVYWWCICNCGKKREVPAERLSHKKLKYSKNVTACVDCSSKRKAPSPERLLQEENARRENNAKLREQLKGQVPNDWLLLPLTEAQAKELKETKFFTGKPCPKGHLDLKRINGGCAECERQKMKEYSKKPEVRKREREQQRERMKNPEYKKKVQERVKEYRSRPEVKEKVNASWRKYREKNIEKVKERFDDWKDRNKDAYRESRTTYLREKRRNDPIFRMQHNLRSRVHWALTHQETTKDETTMKLVGCDLDTLVDFLESNFDNHMSWENYGEWHVDHIRPCASFHLGEDGQQKVCFNWRNLFPLWGEDNQIKGNKYEPKDEGDWVLHMQDLGYGGELFLKYHNHQ
tara:strand:- start:365 stop:1642 length:1278 start_codon:yes stop_codon:yes gene_type:complete